MSHPPIAIDSQHRRLPPLHRGSALYLGNLYAIFYGDADRTRELMGRVSGFFGYGGRLLPIVDLLYPDGPNLLLLERHPEPPLVELFRDHLGLSLPRFEVIEPEEASTLEEGLANRPHLLSESGIQPGAWIDGFVADTELERLGQRFGLTPATTCDASRHANDKGKLRLFLEAEGLPRFDGGLVHDQAEVVAMAAQLKSMGYRRAALRAAIGASGFGFWPVDLLGGAPLPHPPHLFEHGPALLEGWMEPGIDDIEEVVSPSVQFFIHQDGSARLYDLTGQILRDHAIHEGNIAPPVDLPDPAVAVELLDLSRPLVEWLRGSGYRGPGSIDFLVLRRSKGWTIKVCEINARITGATYPSLLARRLLPGGAWMLRNALFTPGQSGSEVIAALHQSGLMFHPGAASGVFPENLIHHPDGRLLKGQLLFLAPSSTDCLKLAETVGRRLSDRLSYE